MNHLFIPYSALLHATAPLTFTLCGASVSLRLAERDRERCFLSLPVDFLFGGVVPCRCVSVPVGTSFEVEYRGVVCEVRIGRRFEVTDA